MMFKFASWLCVMAWFPVQAASAGQIAVYVEGKDAARVQSYILENVPEGVKPLAPGAVKKALPWPRLGKRVGKGPSRAKVVQKIQSAAEELGASVVVVGKSKAAGKRVRKVWLLAIDVASGDLLIDAPVRVRKTKKKGRKAWRWRAMAKALRPVFERAQGEPTPAEAGEDPNWSPPPEQESLVDDSAPMASAPSAQEINNEAVQEVVESFTTAPEESGPSEQGSSENAVAASSTTLSRRASSRASVDHDRVDTASFVLEPQYYFAARRFSYGGADPNSALRPYDATGISVVGVHLEFFPGMLGNIRILRDIGVEASFATALGLKSSPADNSGVDFDNDFQTLDIGLKTRFRIGRGSLALGAGYGREQFVFRIPPGDPLVGEVPAVDYQYVKAGLEGRYSFGRVSIFGGGEFRHFLSLGRVGDGFFPDATVLGLAGKGGLGFGLASWLEFQVSGVASWYSYTLNPAANAVNIARTATDLYYGGRASVVAHF